MMLHFALFLLLLLLLYSEVFFPLITKSNHNCCLEKLQVFPPLVFTFSVPGFGDRAEAEITNGRVEFK